MLIALLLLIALAAGVAAMLLVQPDTGYVLISYGPWVMETSLTALVVGIVFLVLVAYALTKLCVGLIHLPQRLKTGLHQRRIEKANRSFQDGLMQLFEGRWKQAELELVRYAGDHPGAHLNYLAAARAAQRLKANDRRDHYLTLAEQHAPDQLRSAILVTQAELQQQQRDYQAARSTAERLRNIEQDHPYALEILAEAHAELGEWRELRDLLQKPSATDALEDGRLNELLLRALRGLIAEAVTRSNLESLKAAWDSAGSLQDNPILRRDYVRALARLGADSEAAAVVTKALDRNWDAQLAAAYADLTVSDPMTQLSSVEAWLQTYGEHPQLLAAAGRACMRQRLWGKAQSYLESALRLNPTPGAYLALAQLSEATQQPQDAARYYREGLKLTVDGTSSTESDNAATAQTH